MKKVIAGIFLGLAVIIIALLIAASTKPDTFRVERSLNIKSRPEKIAGVIIDFHNWGSWSPWEKLDPAIKRTFSGAERGKGAVYSWEGNSDVGTGSMEILDTSPAKITIKLDFLKPFEGHSIAEFMFESKSDSSTQVTWAMHGPNQFMGKVMSVFMDMDHMIGKDFETGLSNMKTLSEK